MGILQRFFGPNPAKLAANGDVDGLVAVVGSEATSELRVEALHALAGFDEPTVQVMLVDSLGDSDPAMVEAAKGCLRELGEAAAGSLVEALGSDHGELCRELLLELGENAVEPLREACSHNEEAVRTMAMDGLFGLEGELDTDEVRETVFRTVLASLGDRSPSLRRRAAETLAERGDARAAKALAAQLKDGDEEVRNACREALAAIGSDAVLHLSDATRDRNPNARRLAADLLGELCVEGIDTTTRSEVLEALVQKVRDGQQEVREAVLGALEAIPADDVLEARLAELEDPECFEREEVIERVTTLLEHAAIAEANRSAALDRLRSLGYTADD